MVELEEIARTSIGKSIGRRGHINPNLVLGSVDHELLLWAVAYSHCGDNLKIIGFDPETLKVQQMIPLAGHKSGHKTETDPTIDSKLIGIHDRSFFLAHNGVVNRVDDNGYFETDIYANQLRQKEVDFCDGAITLTGDILLFTEDALGVNNYRVRLVQDPRGQSKRLIDKKKEHLQYHRFTLDLDGKVYVLVANREVDPHGDGYIAPFKILRCGAGGNKLKPFDGIDDLPFYKKQYKSMAVNPLDGTLWISAVDAEDDNCYYSLLVVSSERVDKVSFKNRLFHPHESDAVPIVFDNKGSLYASIGRTVVKYLVK